jgi:hypothetical protein
MKPPMRVSNFCGSFCLSLFCRRSYWYHWFDTGILGGVFVLTGLIGFCPLYTVFRFNTCTVKK